MQIFRKTCSTGSYEFQVSNSFNGVLKGVVLRYNKDFSRIFTICDMDIRHDKLISKGWREVESPRRSLEEYIENLEHMVSSGSHVIPIRSVIENIKVCIK